MRYLNAIRKVRGTLLCIMLLMSAVLNAQANQKEKVESMRVAFITHRLNLTADEAKVFWPVYNKRRDDLAALRKNFYPKDDGTDPHLDATRQLEFEQKKLDIKKRYNPEFERVLGKEKNNLRIGAEEDFKKMLMQITRNRKEQKSNPK